MKKLFIIAVAALVTSCNIYKPYTRPDVKTDALYGSAETADTTTLGDLHWTEVFTDPQLQQIITRALEQNTDLQRAHLSVEQSFQGLKVARLSYIPSLNFAPQASMSSFDGSDFVKTYTIPVAASWQVDIFNSITNNKRRSKAVYAQSLNYEQAVKTQIIAGVANLYYTLLMLDSQYQVTEETVAKWRQGVETMRSMKEAGMANDAGVAQYEGTCYSIEASLRDIAYARTQVENSLCSLLGEAPHTIERGELAGQTMPETLAVGVPLQMLSNRPDVRIAENNLMAAYYATASARSAQYPKITLSGTAGWTNNAGSMIINPGKLLLNFAASLTQPIFNAGGLRAQVKIAKSQQEAAKISFQQTLLNAGAEVNNALVQCQTSRDKSQLRKSQIESMQRAVDATELLMKHGSTTYLEVLTAQQSLLSARLSQITDRFDEIEGVINLYQALGGGRDLTSEEEK